jgi:hypothetical protein
MEFQQLVERALQIRAQYSELEQSRYGRSWENDEIALGFVGDVGDLAKLVIAHNGVRNIPDAHERLAHELSDCLWSIIVLSHNYGFDLEAIFLENLDALEKLIEQQKNSGDQPSKPPDNPGVQELEAFLKQHACTNEGDDILIFYGAVYDFLGINSENIAERNRVHDMLGEISSREHAAGHPLLSVIVVTQDNYLPGRGFYSVARRSFPKEYGNADDLTIFVTEFNKVKASKHRYCTTIL